MCKIDRIYRLKTPGTDTYDHRSQKTEDPVRSPVLKLRTGRLVLWWVTTWEYRLLYVFAFCGSKTIFFPFFLGRIGARRDRFCRRLKVRDLALELTELQHPDLTRQSCTHGRQSAVQTVRRVKYTCEWSGCKYIVVLVATTGASRADSFLQALAALFIHSSPDAVSNHTARPCTSP